MTIPMLPGMQPAGPQRDASGYVQMAGGYDAAVQQANRGTVPQYQPQQTQLGQGTPQALGNQQSLLPDSVSPLSQMAPRISGVPDRQPQQQQVQQQLFPQQQVSQQQQLQQQAPQLQVPQGVDVNARLGGPNVPPELQGRSVGEMIGMLNGLRQVHLASMTQQPQVQQVMTPQVQAGLQPAPQAFDWKNPQESIGRVVDDRLNRAIDERLVPVLAPVVQQNQLSAATAARNVAAQEVGAAFAQLEPLVLQRLQGLKPADLQNPETWRVATRAVIGDVMIAAAQRQGQQGPQFQQGGPGMYPAQQVQQGQNPMPNLNGFFSEQPVTGGQMNTGVRLTAQQTRAAELMGMSTADYAAWSVGVPAGGQR